LYDERRSGFKACDSGVIVGPIWLIGWLFTIGFLGASFWKAVMAILFWPYFLGVALRLGRLGS
jgi:hypothetical protein